MSDNSVLNNFINSIKGRINSFISNINYSENNNPLDNIKFPFVKKRNISVSQIKSQISLSSYLKYYDNLNNLQTYDFFTEKNIPRKNNSYNKSSFIDNNSQSLLGKKTYREFPVNSNNKININKVNNNNKFNNPIKKNTNNIYTINTSIRNTQNTNYLNNLIHNKNMNKINYLNKNNENKIINNKINYKKIKSNEIFIEEKRNRNNNIIKKNNEGNNIIKKKEKIIKKEIEKKDNININDNESNKSEKIDKNDNISLNEKEFNININDSFLTIKLNKYNSFSLNNSKVFNSELVLDSPQSFSIILNVPKTNDNKNIFIYSKQNEFSYKIPEIPDKENKMDENTNLNNSITQPFPSKYSFGISSNEKNNNNNSTYETKIEKSSDKGLFGFNTENKEDIKNEGEKTALKNNSLNNNILSGSQASTIKSSNKLNNKTYSNINSSINNDSSKEKNKKSIFDSSKSINIFTNNLKNNEESSINLFSYQKNSDSKNEIKEGNNLLLNESKNNSNSLFGENIKSNSLFGVKDDKKEIKLSLFSDTKTTPTITGSLFGAQSTEGKTLFSSNNEIKKEENNNNKLEINQKIENKGNLFGNIGLFGSTIINDNKTSLFGNIENNKNSLFNNKSNENK